MPKTETHTIRKIGPRASIMLFYFQSMVGGLVIFFLIAMFLANILLGFFDLLIISFVAASMLTILIFLDIHTLLSPKGLKTNVLGVIFAIILLSPILIGLFFPIAAQNEFMPVAYTFFYCLFYGGWNLSVYTEQKEAIEKAHPKVMILLVQRGSFFLAYAYISVISFLFVKFVTVESIYVRISFLLMMIAYILPALKDMLTLSKFQFYLHKTKKGRKLLTRSLTNHWKETVDKRLYVRIIWYLALPAGILSLYVGSVSLYYFGLIVFNLERLLLGVLSIGSGLSVLSYYWARTGFFSDFVAALSSLPRKKPTPDDLKESIRDLQKWCGVFLGAVFALINLLRYTGIRTFLVFQGVEINDLTFVYIDVFWLLSILIFSETLLSLIKAKRPTDISKISRHVNYLYISLWYFLAGLTGSYAYALGIPPLLDAIIVVTFLLAITAYRLYVVYSWR